VAVRKSAFGQAIKIVTPTPRLDFNAEVEVGGNEGLDFLRGEG